MARSNFVYTVTKPTSPGGPMAAVPGIGVTVYSVNSSGVEGAMAATYENRTGSTPAILVTDEFGFVSFWVDTGDYNVHFIDEQTIPRINPFVIGFTPSQVSDVTSSVEAAVWFVGDLKWSTQSADHGLNTDGTHAWLQVVSDPGDGGGRKVNAAAYPGLWAQLGGALTNPLDGAGNFRLPNLSGRALIVTGTASGLSTRTIFVGWGTEIHTHRLSNNGGAGLAPVDGNSIGYIVNNGPSIFVASKVVGTGSATSQTVPSFGLVGATDAEDQSQPSCGMNIFIKS